MPDITEQELQSLIKVGIAEAKLEILIGDFKQHKQDEEKRLAAIDLHTSEIFKIIRAFPDRVNECRDELEVDIKDIYMTKKDGAILEQHLASNIKSIKIWIVSSVGGFSAAGLLLAWIFKLAGFHIN